MIYIFGDSHASRNFSNYREPYADCHEVSVTMHRIGRDKIIPKFNRSFLSPENIFIFCYGEVDCRCHIGKQMRLGRDIDEVCNTLVNKYIDAIKENITSYKAIVISFIVPTSNREEYEKKYNDFPFVGDDAERVVYTQKMNALLESVCKREGFHFVDCTDLYSNQDGTLRSELSDGNVHIKENQQILLRLYNLLNE